MSRTTITITKLAIFLALALSVCAQHEDTVVPESTQEVEPMALVETASEEAENAAAHQEADSYLKKAGSDACKALADSAEKAVKDNVKAEQAILDKVDKGAKCPEEGQDAVGAMKKKLNEAKYALKKADKKYADEQNADVDFGKRQYSSLIKGNCDTFFNSQAYKNAATKVKDAKKKADEAKGLVKQAQKSLDAAIAAAKLAVTKCQCNTYQAHKKALAAANTAVKSANSKSWTKAVHLKCVLAGTPYNSCTVPAIPLVKATSVAAGVVNGACNLWEGLPQYRNVAGLMGNKYGYIQQFYRATNTQGWNSGAYMKGQMVDPKDGPFKFKTTYEDKGMNTWRNYASNAAWGITSAPTGKFDTDQFDFAFYCFGAGQKAQYIEKGKYIQDNTCTCGNGQTKTKIIVDKNGSVGYYMSSNYHGMMQCRKTYPGVAKGAYVWSSSIYGAAAALTNIELLTQESRGPYAWKRITK